MTPKPIRILYFSNAVFSNNSWWRGLGPLYEMQRCEPDVFSIHLLERIDWSVLRNMDVLWLSNPLLDQTPNLILDARRAGMKVVVDVDDLYWEIPRGNPVRLELQAGHLKILDAAVKMADLVIVPTPTLRDELLRCSGTTTPVTIAVNGWPDNAPWPPPDDCQSAIVWRGGPVHEPDMTHDLARQVLKWMPVGWFFLAAGSEPRAITEVFPESRCNAWPMMPIDHFHRRRATLRPAIIFNPLSDNTFSRCRSPISYIEAANAGAILVAPDWPQFKDLPGMVRYSDPKNIEVALQAACDMARDEGNVASARAHIDQHMRSRNGNVVRSAALKALFQ